MGVNTSICKCGVFVRTFRRAPPVGFTIRILVEFRTLRRTFRRIGATLAPFLLTQSDQVRIA